jgi:ankyrin repeat protein
MRRDFAKELDEYQRIYFAGACQDGELAVVQWWLRHGSTPCSRVPSWYFCNEDDDDDCDHVVTSPIWVAAAYGQIEVMKLLLAGAANPQQRASDGSTPFFVACSAEHLEVIQLLHASGVDMTQADNAGITPANIAACKGNCELMKLLYDLGVDMDTPGSIYLGAENEVGSLKANMTPLTIAKELGHTAVQQFLKSVRVKPEKKQRSALTMHERAVRVGVAHKLKPIPQTLRDAAEKGSPTQQSEAKRAIKLLQTANQQVVSRAEKAGSLRQQTLTSSIASSSEGVSNSQRCEECQ